MPNVELPGLCGVLRRSGGMIRVRPDDEPPGADPHAGWCGEGRLEAGPYPIGRHFATC
jgi:hypothetical protein